MRTQLCPPEMVDQEGNFEEVYFKPRMRNNMVWTEKEEALLVEGVLEFGVGHWMQIRRAKLREWDEVEIRLKCARLMGRQDLSCYEDCIPKKIYKMEKGKMGIVKHHKKTTWKVERL